MHMTSCLVFFVTKVSRSLTNSST